ncbi:translesion DNA synthesis-associated protein ImuA [Paraburkholderia fungorum]|uniref:translesion DNA synthesis-associated protein ImuA n=1 Tax=Paraburkholderia fungorum TaxID=134537 RepID=UPI00402BE723
MSALPQNVEDIHPSLWKGNQLARSVSRTVATGYDRLTRELPGGGWPLGALVELMVQQPGIGELRLLQPALLSVAKRAIVLVKPPKVPNALGLSYIGMPAYKLMRLEPQSAADALWSTEQILKANTCGAVILWQQHIRAESLRRLSLHAQSSEALFFVLRPLAAAQDTSPASLRLSLRPIENGVQIEIIKRKGPVGVDPFNIELKSSPILLSPHGRSRVVRSVEAKVAQITESAGA